MQIFWMFRYHCTNFMLTWKRCQKSHCTCLGVSVATCMAILQVGSGLQLRSASTGTKEEDYENDAATIVQKCVSINQTLSVYLCVSWDNKHELELISIRFFVYPPHFKHSQLLSIVSKSTSNPSLCFQYKCPLSLWHQEWWTSLVLFAAGDIWNDWPSDQ